MNKKNFIAIAEMFIIRRIPKIFSNGLAWLRLLRWAGMVPFNGGVKNSVLVLSRYFCGKVQDP